MIKCATFYNDLKRTLTTGLRVARNGEPLPNPRILSNEVSKKAGNDTTSSFMTIYVMQMGQFLDHDFSHTPNYPNAKDCCGPLENRSKHCIPIDIPSDDPFFSTFVNPDTNLQVECMTLTRSMTSPDLKCSLDVERQQVISKL